MSFSCKKLKKLKSTVLFLIVLSLSACSSVDVKPVTHYDLTEKSHLYQLKQWSFTGRLGVTSATDSWSASIEWQHKPHQDKIKLAGPLGQGAVAITLTEENISIDTGEKIIQESENIDALIQQQLGVFVPVQALRYWVLGVTAPDKSYEIQTNGFTQAQWLIRYLQMQQLESQQWMPRKLTAQQQQTKLKLIIDNWDL